MITVRIKTNYEEYQKSIQYISICYLIFSNRNPNMASNVLESYGIDPEERLKRMERLANDFTIDRHQPIRRYTVINH